MKILVTGGAGFIGSHTCKALLNRGDEVVAIDNFDPLYDKRVKQMNVDGLKSYKGFSFVEGDITDFKFLEELFAKHKFDKVVHLAALASVPRSMEEPLDYAHVNYCGTINLLELCAKSKVQNFVFASSSSVYGGRTNVPFKETDDITKSISMYASTKAAGELACYTYHHIYKMPITCLRFFTVYGPNQRPYGMAHQRFIKQVYRGEPVTIYGDGSMARDYTYVGDVVAGILGALDKNLPYEVINLGNSNVVTLNELVKSIEKALNKKAKVKNLDIPPTEVPITASDISKAKKLLGYCPKINLDEGVKKQVDFFLGAPSWYKELPA